VPKEQLTIELGGMPTSASSVVIYFMLCGTYEGEKRKFFNLTFVDVAHLVNEDIRQRALAFGMITPDAGRRESSASL
jgi:hypothetical protein